MKQKPIPIAITIAEASALAVLVASFCIQTSAAGGKLGNRTLILRTNSEKWRHDLPRMRAVTSLFSGCSSCWFPMKELTRRVAPRETERKGMILDDLADQRRWVAWHIEVRDGRSTKIPIDPSTGGRAQIPTNSATWGTQRDAKRRWKQIANGDGGGIGIVAIAPAATLKPLEQALCFDRDRGHREPTWACMKRER
jgi:hypothetical protein